MQKKKKEKLLSNLNEDQGGSVEIFQAILNRACPTLLDKSLIPHLLKTARQPKGRRQASSKQKTEAAQEILKEISISYPVMFEGCLKDIVQEISKENDNISSKSYPPPPQIMIAY